MSECPPCKVLSVARPTLEAPVVDKLETVSTRYNEKNKFRVHLPEQRADGRVGAYADQE